MVALGNALISEGLSQKDYLSDIVRASLAAGTMLTHVIDRVDAKLKDLSIDQKTPEEVIKVKIAEILDEEIESFRKLVESIISG